MRRARCTERNGLSEEYDWHGRGSIFPGFLSHGSVDIDPFRNQPLLPINIARLSPRSGILNALAHVGQDLPVTEGLREKLES